MLDISLFFTPVEQNVFIDANEYNLSSSITCYFNSFPDIHQKSIVIFGVLEDRCAKSIAGAALAPNAIRKKLYKLSKHVNNNLPIIDLGNIAPGNTVDDTYFAVSQVIKELVKNNCIPILLGASQDLTYANYLAYQALEQVVNIVSIDSNFDLGNEQDQLNHNSYLSKIVLHQPNFLFNYSNIGYQTYLESQHTINLMSKMFFDSYRLGAIQKNIEEAEPIIRNADIVSFDLNSVKACDCPASELALPNGFTGQEICQLARYAGASDKISSFGIYNLIPSFDIRDRSANLAAQVIWFFIDGLGIRTNELPSDKNDNFLKYHVSIEKGNHQLLFYKHKISNKWWMAVPYPPDKRLKFERHTLIPCSQQDYHAATQNEIPDKWWQTYQKLF